MEGFQDSAALRSEAAAFLQQRNTSQQQREAIFSLPLEPGDQTRARVLSNGDTIHLELQTSCFVLWVQRCTGEAEGCVGGAA